MKALLNTTPNMSVEVEGETSADLFEQISIAQEVFTHEKCGCCNKSDFKFVVRTNDDEDKFYELHCNDFKCKAKLSFGSKKKPKGALYPKRHWNSLSDGDKKNRNLEEQPKNLWLPNNGWFKWVPQAAQKEENN
jgi:hypothetical protein